MKQNRWCERRITRMFVVARPGRLPERGAAEVRCSCPEVAAYFVPFKNSCLISCSPGIKGSTLPCRHSVARKYPLAETSQIVHHITNAVKLHGGVHRTGRASYPIISLRSQATLWTDVFDARKLEIFPAAGNWPPTSEPRDSTQPQVSLHMSIE
jgi:hypothetical protein